MTKPDPLIDHYADRVLSTQPVNSGSLHGDGPPTPLQVAAVMHALADHTHLVHVINTIVEKAALATPGDTFNPPATSLGRYFHALGDSIERKAVADRWDRIDNGGPTSTPGELLQQMRAYVLTDTRITPERRDQFRTLIDTLTGTPSAP